MHVWGEKKMNAIRRAIAIVSVMIVVLQVMYHFSSPPIGDFLLLVGCYSVWMISLLLICNIINYSNHLEDHNTLISAEERNIVEHEECLTDTDENISSSSEE